MKKIFTMLCIAMVSVSAARADLLTVQPYDRIYGNEDAPVTLVEYASLSCPHCADFHLNFLPTIKERYVDTGKVRVLLRNFATNGPALRGAMVALCVEPDQYYSFMNAMFSTQAKWAMSLDFLSALESLVRVGGVSPEMFQQCVTNEELEKAVLDIRRTATDELDVQATPTFFIGGTKIQGFSDVEEFSALIDEAIAAAEQGDVVAVEEDSEE